MFYRWSVQCNIVRFHPWFSEQHPANAGYKCVNYMGPKDPFRDNMSSELVRRPLDVTSRRGWIKLGVTSVCTSFCGLQIFSGIWRAKAKEERYFYVKFTRHIIIWRGNKAVYKSSKYKSAHQINYFYNQVIFKRQGVA